MSVKEQEIEFDSPIAIPLRIMQEEEDFTFPKQVPKNEERQIEYLELAPKKTREQQEGKLDPKLTLKKARQMKEKQFKKLKQIGFENSQPEKQIINDPKAKNETYHYCHQKNMRQIRMRTKIMIRQGSKAQKREQYLRNLPAGEAIKSEEVQLYEPQMSQSSQDIILTEEQEKQFQEIQDSFQEMKKQLQANKYSPQEILYNLPRLSKNYRATFRKMKIITQIATIGLIYNQAYKCQIEKELTQAQKKTYEKQLSAIDKIFQHINQRIDYYFPGERDSIYKSILPEKLYLIYKKYNQQKMSIKQKQASVHILKMQ